MDYSVFEYGLAMLAIYLGTAVILFLAALFFFALNAIQFKDYDWYLFSEWVESIGYLLVIFVLTWLSILVLPLQFMKLFGIY